MRYLPVLLGVVVVTAAWGCGDAAPPAGSVAGTWTLDVAETRRLGAWNRNMVWGAPMADPFGEPQEKGSRPGEAFLLEPHTLILAPDGRAVLERKSSPSAEEAVIEVTYELQDDILLWKFPAADGRSHIRFAIYTGDRLFLYGGESGITAVYKRAE